MKLELIGFRELPEQLTFKIRLADDCPLILIKQNGIITWARTRGDKDKLVSKFTESDCLLFAWTGKYRTDMFALTRADLDRNYV